MTIEVEVAADEAAAARQAANWIAAEARAAVHQRGRFTLAVSGGHTPWRMLRELAEQELPWHAVHLFQVDERVAPAADSDRNLVHIAEALRAPAGRLRLHAMPVEDNDLDAAARAYAATLREVCGDPPVLDLAHLGLGADGHTASLVPGDPVLDAGEALVAITAPYQGHRRMTLTYPVLNRARRILWLATGPEKRPMVKRLLAGDATIPAGRVASGHARLIADRAAAAA